MQCRVISSKVGICNLSPHLRNSAILRTTKSIAEGLRTKKSCGCNCGPSKFDFRNSITLRSLLLVLLLSSPFSSDQDGFKNQPKIFLDLSVSLETKNLPSRGSCMRFFTSNFFCMNRLDYTAKNMPKIAEVKPSSCMLKVADL